MFRVLQWRSSCRCRKKENSRPTSEEKDRDDVPTHNDITFADLARILSYALLRCKQLSDDLNLAHGFDVRQSSNDRPARGPNLWLGCNMAQCSSRLKSNFKRACTGVSKLPAWQIWDHGLQHFMIVELWKSWKTSADPASWPMRNPRGGETPHSSTSPMDSSTSATAQGASSLSLPDLCSKSFDSTTLWRVITGNKQRYCFDSFLRAGIDHSDRDNHIDSLRLVSGSPDNTTTTRFPDVSDREAQTAGSSGAQTASSSLAMEVSTMNIRPLTPWSYNQILDLREIVLMTIRPRSSDRHHERTTGASALVSRHGAFFSRDPHCI